MTDGLSRRDLMLLAGAGATLAACNRPAGGRGAQVMYGRWPTHGRSASAGPKYDLGRKGPDFDPKYITLVHIGFYDKWKIYINQACYAYKKDDGDRLDRAITLFRQVRLKDGTRVRFKDLKDPYRPYPRGESGYLDSVDFENFGFNSQHEIFFLFDNPEVRFKEDWLITFAPFSDTDEKMYRNYSFFDDKPVEVKLYDMAKTDAWIIRVSNYFTNSMGGTLDNKDKEKARRYAMNLHFQMRSSEGRLIPMVIDPETGNGAGHEP